MGTTISIVRLDCGEQWSLGFLVCIVQDLGVINLAIDCYDNAIPLALACAEAVQVQGAHTLNFSVLLVYRRWDVSAGKF